MKTQRNWMLALATSLFFLAAPALAQAQFRMPGPPPSAYHGPIPNAAMPPGYGPGPMMGNGPRAAMPPGYGQVPMGNGIQQASFHGCDSCGGGGCGACMGPPVAGGFRLANLHQGGGPAYGGCGDGACGGGGGCATGACGGGLGGLLGGGLGGLGGGLGGMLANKQNARHGGFATIAHGQQNGPFGGGGCCTPIWYDFHVEAMHLRRDEVGDNVDLTSLDAGGPIVLSTDDLSMNDAVGFRATYALLIGPSTNLELTYFGTHDWSDAESVSDANSQLFSVFSNFGAVILDQPDPLPDQQGFPQTVDAAIFHGIEYSSELHNAELNLRRRWTSAGCLLHGSYLAGVRYASLNETFRHNTQVATGGFLSYDVATENDLVGFQIGTDLHICVSPRFKFGAEIEAGLYGNSSDYAGSVNTREVTRNPDGSIASSVDANPVNESDDKTDAALLVEAGLVGTFRITPRLTLRGGYTGIFIDGVALATENFNTTDAPFAQVGRSVAVDNGGEVFYHGANLGLTWMW